MSQWSFPNPLLFLLGTWAVEHFDPVFKTAVSLNKALEDLIVPYINAHEENQEMGDYIDSYLKEIQKSDNYKSSFYGKRGKDSLLASLMDIFLGGIETTASTLNWGILYMLHYPHVQKAVHQELDENLDGKRQITIEDKGKIPYTCAVINEIMRHSNIVPTANRTTTKAIQIDDLTIPEGSLVIGNLAGINKDSRFWNNPDEFDPSRFLDINNGSCTGSEHLVNFGIGRRVCPGQTLAEKELFLFFTGMMRAFEFKPIKGRKLPRIDENRYVQINYAPPFEVVLKRRNRNY